MARVSRWRRRRNGVHDRCRCSARGTTLRSCGERRCAAPHRDCRPAARADGARPMIELVWPWAALALPLPWLLRRWARPVVRPEPALTVPDASSFGAESSPTGASRTWPPRALLLATAWALLVLAVMRPQHTGDPVSLPATGRDLMLAVDISGSMSTEDMVLDDSPATRLAAVKRVVNE